jgi:hypothetical protein
MPWPCVLYPSRDAARAAGGGRVPVGAMWPMDAEDFDAWAERERNQYLARGLNRPPHFVKLPDGSEFCIDSRAWTPDRGYYGEGWNPVGEPPLVTLSPSINVQGRYHGYIQNGVITDDCEGRTFPEAGG